MGNRYDRMVRQIVAFRAHVRRTRGRFKLGQDETVQTRTEMLGKLANPAARSLDEPVQSGARKPTAGDSLKRTDASFLPAGARFCSRRNFCLPLLSWILPT